MSPVSERDDGVGIAIQVQPKASRTEVAGIVDGLLRVRVAAPPVDGTANQELIRWLSKQLKVGKSNIVIVSGERGRRKLVSITGITASEVEDRLGLL